MSSNCTSTNCYPSTVAHFFQPSGKCIVTNCYRNSKKCIFIIYFDVLLIFITCVWFSCERCMESKQRKLRYPWTRPGCSFCAWVLCWYASTLRSKNAIKSNVAEPPNKLLLKHFLTDEGELLFGGGKASIADIQKFEDYARKNGGRRAAPSSSLASIGMLSSSSTKVRPPAAPVASPLPAPAHVAAACGSILGAAAAASVGSYLLSSSPSAKPPPPSAKRHCRRAEIIFEKNNIN